MIVLSNLMLNVWIGNNFLSLCVMCVKVSYVIKFQDELLDSNSNMSNFAKQGGSKHNCLCPFSATILVHCKAVAKDCQLHQLYATLSSLQ